MKLFEKSSRIAKFKKPLKSRLMLWSLKKEARLVFDGFKERDP